MLDRVEAGIRAEGIEPGAIAQIVLTHTHANHAGLAAALHARTGAPILVHERGAKTIARFAAAIEDRGALVVRAARAAAVPEPLIAAFADLSNAQLPSPESVPADAIRTLADRAALAAGDATWTVVHLPGHAADHIALVHRASGVVIAGDMLLRGIPSQPGLEPRTAGGRPRTLAVLMDSLKRLSRLDAAIVLPGHGAPIRAHRVLVARRLAHIRARLVAAHAAVAAGARTLWDVMGALDGAIEAPADLPPRLAEGIALVDWLIEHRRVARAVREGVVELGVGG